MEDKMRKFYGQRDVPNITLICINEGKSQEIFFDSVVTFVEDYDNRGYFKIEIDLPLFSPEIYETLTSQWNKFEVHTQEHWKSIDTLKDEEFNFVRHFNRLKITRKLTQEGDPTRWHITLWKEITNTITSSISNYSITHC